MSKIYAITMLVIFNNRLKITGGRFDQEEEGESSSNAMLTASRERRNSRTKIFVSNTRLTFQLGSEVPTTPVRENMPSSSLIAPEVCLHTHHISWPH